MASGKKTFIPVMRAVDLFDVEYDKIVVKIHDKNRIDIFYIQDQIEKKFRYFVRGCKGVMPPFVSRKARESGNDNNFSFITGEDGVLYDSKTNEYYKIDPTTGQRIPPDPEVIKIYLKILELDRVIYEKAVALNEDWGGKNILYDYVRFADDAPKDKRYITYRPRLQTWAEQKKDPRTGAIIEGSWTGGPRRPTDQETENHACTFCKKVSKANGEGTELQAIYTDEYRTIGYGAELTQFIVRHSLTKSQTTIYIPHLVEMVIVNKPGKPFPSNGTKTGLASDLGDITEDMIMNIKPPKKSKTSASPSDTASPSHEEIPYERPSAIGDDDE